MGPFLIIKAPIVGSSGDAGCFKAIRLVDYGPFSNEH